MSEELLTTHGAMTEDELDLILPHEHIFVDLGPIEEERWRMAQAPDVVSLMGPEVTKAMDCGVTALVECTPVGVGRRADIDIAVSEATGLPIVLPTGVYREPHVPDWAIDASEEALASWMLDELTAGIEDTQVCAAWIKVAASDGGLTEVEEKILRAAAHAGADTGALIGSHTTAGEIALTQLDIIEDAGHNPERFVWIHTQNEEDSSLHRAVAERGAWIEYDAIGGAQSDEYYLDRIVTAVDAGLGDQVLLSMDRGWYDPSQPGGGEPDPFTYLPTVFLPKLREAVGDATARMLTSSNPFRAFSRSA